MTLCQAKERECIRNNKNSFRRVDFGTSLLDSAPGMISTSYSNPWEFLVNIFSSALGGEALSKIISDPDIWGVERDNPQFYPELADGDTEYEPPWIELFMSD